MMATTAVVATAVGFSLRQTARRMRENEERQKGSRYVSVERSGGGI